MTYARSGQSIPIQLTAGQTLVVKELSGTSSVSGGSAKREAAGFIGAGFVIYGPQSTAATVTLTTTGECDWYVVNGDPQRRDIASLSGDMDQSGNVSTLYTPSGAQVGGGGVRRAGLLALRYLTNNVSLAPVSGGITFRQIFQVPFTGRCLVRGVYETVQATPAARTAAFAGGRSIADPNPIAADGSAATWGVAAAMTPSAATASGDPFTWGRGKTDAVMVDVPAPTDGGVGGYIYASTIYATGTGADALAGNPTRPLTDWAQYINARLPGMKYRQWYASGNFVASNQGAMPNASEQQYAPIAWLEITPLSDVFWGLNIGDSTSQAMSAGNQSVALNNYSWSHIGAHARLMAGSCVHVSHFAHEGATNAQYMGAQGVEGRLSAVLADPDYLPSFVVMQPASLNASGAGLDQSAADVSLTNTLNWCRKLRALGVQPILRTVLPSPVLDGTREAVRQRVNAAIRASGYPVFDIDAILRDPLNPAAIAAQYTYDGTHVTITGNELAGRDHPQSFANVLAGLGI